VATAVAGNPVVAAINQLVADSRVRLAMLMGSGLESGWNPSAVGDNGTSFGPYQMHIGGALTAAHGSPAQAHDPVWATRAMLGAYTAAVRRVPDSLWQSDPRNAAALAAYYAERPAAMYPASRVDSTWNQIRGGISTATAQVGAAIAFARRQIGKPYLWAGEGPGAFDCSGLTKAAWHTAGVELPHNARAQYAATHPVSSPQPGDLVFFGSSAATIHHVGLYLGGGQMIDAPSQGHPIGIHQVSSYGDYFGATRVTTGAAAPATGDTAGGTQGFNPLKIFSPSEWAAEGRKLGITLAFVGAGLALVVAGALTGVAPRLRQAAAATPVGALA
jgi:cell wall-associated NlpC family hydrolase